jgi:hypothetical protein
MTFLRCGRQTTWYPVQNWKVILNSDSNISDSAHLRVPCKTLVVWSRCSQRVHWSPTVGLELILWREIFSKGTRTHKRQYILPNKAGGEGGGVRQPVNHFWQHTFGNSRNKVPLQLSQLFGLVPAGTSWYKLRKVFCRFADAGLRPGARPSRAKIGQAQLGQSHSLQRLLAWPESWEAKAKPSGRGFWLI